MHYTEKTVTGAEASFVKDARDGVIYVRIRAKRNTEAAGFLIRHLIAQQMRQAAIKREEDFLLLNTQVPKGRCTERCEIKCAAEELDEFFGHLESSGGAAALQRDDGPDSYGLRITVRT